MSIIKNISINCAIAILAVGGFYCAGQLPPSGGPSDTTSPVIVETYPISGALRYHDNKFSFSFNKYISRRTLQESFFVSPPISDLTFDWSGKDVEVSFTDSLRKNTTYIITLGTDVIDVRNNRLSKAFTLPFSTGDKIDSCSISGTVVDDKPEGVMIFAYKTDSILTDTLNPQKTKPTYVTQTGKDGSFNLSYLAFGTYRIFAVRDQYKNLLYDPQVDEYGVFNNDVVLSPSRYIQNDLHCRLSAEDTTKPFLSSARSIDNRHVLLKLSESIDPFSIIIDSTIIVDTLTSKALKMLDLSLTDATNKEAQVVTEIQEIARPYRITLTGWKDLRGNVISRQLSFAVFDAGMNPDTTKPTMGFIDLTNNSKDILLDDSIHINFSEAVCKMSFEHGFKLYDSLHLPVRGKFEWQGSTRVSFIPTQIFSMGMAYHLEVRMDSLLDFTGNSYRDSVARIQFQTVEEQMLSGISGSIDDDDTSAKGTINITAKNISKQQSKPKMQILNEPGKFKFENLLEGKYVLSVFRDTDGDGNYSFGKPFPFVASERFTIYPDTLKLRARWPLEGISIKLK